jgi:hypothetical protein
MKRDEMQIDATKLSEDINAFCLKYNMSLVEFLSAFAIVNNPSYYDDYLAQIPPHMFKEC